MTDRPLPATIREIRPDELAATADLRRDMYQELDGTDLDERHPDWRRRHVAFYGGLIAANRGQVFVAEHEGTSIGMAAVYKLANHRSEILGQASAYVSNVYVVPAWRRKGIARALTLRTVGWAKDNGCIVVRLRTSSMGRPVYEGLGFRSTQELELVL
jgi:GNAT superfamily N-acetyltransferase